MPFSYRSTCWKIKSDTAFKDWGWELEYMLRITDLKAHFTVVSLKDMTSIENILAPYLRTRVDAGVHVMKAWYWGILISFHSSHSFLNHSIIILKRSPMLYCWISPSWHMTKPHAYSHRTSGHEWSRICRTTGPLRCRPDLPCRPSSAPPHEDTSPLFKWCNISLVLTPSAFLVLSSGLGHKHYGTLWIASALLSVWVLSQPLNSPGGKSVSLVK